MTIKTVGLDLAKNVFQLHGVDDSGNVVLRRTLRRTQVTQLFAQLPPCIIGIESCSSSQYWARKLIGLGHHQARLIPPQFVKPYVKSNKNDANDAAAICEATGRPQMRFVPLKTPEQQSILAVHRVRERFVKARTACANQIRGIMGEFGLTLRRGLATYREAPASRSVMLLIQYPGWSGTWCSSYSNTCDTLSGESPSSSWSSRVGIATTPIHSTSPGFREWA